MGAAGPVLPPAFLDGLFTTLEARFGAFFHGA
jgi:hypothetical protein